MRLVLLALVISGCSACHGPPASVAIEPPGPDDLDPSRPRVVLFIGDGMGAAHLAAAAHYKHGSPTGLHIESLPVRGQVLTTSIDGITDSAASATAMSTGQLTHNGRIALSPSGDRLQTIFELARERGLAIGFVSTTELPHATIAAFTAHNVSRHNYDQISVEQATESQPTVMLGGGSSYIPADDDSFERRAALVSAGYRLVDTLEQLRSAIDDKPERLWGTFAGRNLPFVADRGDTVPSLPEMTLAALDVLNRDPDGFVLVVEGGRIDHASHANNLAAAVRETIEFDDAIAAVDAWAVTQPQISILVTADHECGGLSIVRGNGAGSMPTVNWRWGGHTNVRVGLYGRGPAASPLRDQLIDHRHIYSALAATVERRQFTPPARALLPSGQLDDLAHTAATQSVTTTGSARLASLRVDADERGLAIGLAGLFPWQTHSLVVLIDIDYGDGTGVRQFDGSLADSEGEADTVLTNLTLQAPASAPGFGADFAVVSVGSRECQAYHDADNCGLRGLRSPFGGPGDIGRYRAVVQFDDGVRPGLGSVASRSASGAEMFVVWDQLYPDGLPTSATVGVIAVLTNADGSLVTSQALPSFPAATATASPTGVVTVRVDGDGDGVGDSLGPVGLD